MFSKLPKILISSLFLFLAILIVISIPIAHAATATHIVISEIQLGGSLSSDDFIELYNPTSSAISLNGYRLVKRTSTGTSDESIKVLPSTDSVPSHGYYLWCNSNLSVSLGCNSSSTATVANNNSISLRNGPADTGTIIDSVTIGTVANSLGEGTFITSAPANGESVERKANSSSTTKSMAAGGIDELKGNGEDTDNNANDFVLRSVPQPQNSLSSLEPVPTQTPTNTTTASPTSSETPTVTITSTPSETPTTAPTNTPTGTPSTTPTDTPTTTPTQTPTSAPTGTPTATTTPTLTPSESPTSTPTITPTQTPTPTLSQSPTPTLSSTPTPTGTFPFISIPKFRTVCTTNTISFTIFSIHFHIPMITCTLTTL